MTTRSSVDPLPKMKPHEPGISGHGVGVLENVPNPRDWRSAYSTRPDRYVSHYNEHEPAVT
jgi:hypothetical protein